MLGVLFRVVCPCTRGAARIIAGVVGLVDVGLFVSFVSSSTLSVVWLKLFVRDSRAAICLRGFVPVPLFIFFATSRRYCAILQVLSMSVSFGWPQCAG